MEYDLLSNGSKRCRVCLDYTDNTVYLLDVSNAKRGVVSYLHILTSICNLESENVPQEICRNCAQGAEISYDFKVLCEESDKVLKYENELSVTANTKHVPDYGSSYFDIDKDRDDDCDTDGTLDVMICIKDENIDITFNNLKPDEGDIRDLAKTNSDIKELEDQNEATVESGIMNDVSIVKTKENSCINKKPCPGCKKMFHRNSLTRHKRLCTKIIEVIMNYANNEITEKHAKNDEIPEENLNTIEEKKDGNSYICPVCNKSFTMKRYVRRHIRKCVMKTKLKTNAMKSGINTNSSINEENISCNNCNKIFTKRTSLEKHIKNKNCSLRNPETCQLCDYKPVSNIDYQNHKTTKHLDKCHKYCIYCEFRGLHTDEYKRHLFIEHPDKKFYCKHCKCALYTIRGYSLHMKTHPKEILTCHLCNFSTDASGLLKKHYLNDHSDHFYARQCDFCEFKTNCVTTLATHSLIHDDKKTFQCEKCDKKFFNTRKKVHHEKVYHGHQESKIICEICGKHLKTSQSLRSHMIIHKNERKFKCELCDKSFNTSSCLYSHGFSHSEERVHKCNDCGKCYKTTRHLNNHIKQVHLKLKSKTCNECGKTFVNKDGLLRHSAIHTGIKKYDCDKCDKSFVTKYHLRQHSVVHTGERRHICEVCGKGFTQAHVLRSHLKLHNV